MDIHWYFCVMYDGSAMSNGIERNWARQFNEGWMNTNDKARRGAFCYQQRFGKDRG